MTDDDRFKKLIELSDVQARILDSIRYKDGDQSVKSGAILAFSGLIIATSIVQLSTSSDSVVHVAAGDIVLIALNAIGLLFLFVSAFITLHALIATGKYTNDAEKALLEFDDYVQVKTTKVKIAAGFSLLGSIFVLLALFVQFVKLLVC